MSNINEGYAFITKANYDLYAKDKWTNATSIGSNYKVISFSKSDEQELTGFISLLGFEAKHLSAQETIDAMVLAGHGPFVVYGQDVHTVINHFNPQKEG